MRTKATIGLLAIVTFVLGTAQNFLVARFASTDTAAMFFFLQSFTLFAVTVGASTIMVKTFSKVELDDRVLEIRHSLYHVIVTLILAAVCATYLAVEAKIDAASLILFTLTCLLQANTGLTSFLRLFDQSFISMQFVRNGVLAIKVAALVLLPLETLDLYQLLLVFVAADVASLMAIVWLTWLKRGEFRRVFRKGAETPMSALGWGSFNASLRNLPRLFVFFLAERYYSAQALIDLRLLLLPRENLASMMSILNLVFYREIFVHNARLVFVVSFLASMVFQVGFVLALQLAGLDLELSWPVLLFYASASAVYGVIQQHWNLIKENKESRQLAITATSTALMTASAIAVIALGLSVHLLWYLTIFNATWVALVAAISSANAKSNSNPISSN